MATRHCRPVSYSTFSSSLVLESFAFCCIEHFKLFHSTRCLLCISLHPFICLQTCLCKARLGGHRIASYLVFQCRWRNQSPKRHLGEAPVNAKAQVEPAGIGIEAEGLSGKFCSLVLGNEAKVKALLETMGRNSRDPPI